VAQGIERQALRSAGAAIAFLSALTLLAGAVRVLPLVLDPEMPWRVAAPFARTVAWLALEVAVAVGWPLGWAVALARFVDRGEARVHALLGRSPSEVMRALAPSGLVFAAVLFALSWLAARDAERPGRVLGELLESSRVTCDESEAPRSIPVPFLDARWLCAGPSAADALGAPASDRATPPPRLLLRPPARAGGGAIVTATRARVSGDLRELRLEDVHLHFARGDVAVHELWVRGLPPMLTSATIRPLGRATAVVTAALAVAFGLGAVVLRRRVRNRLIAIGLAAVSMSAAFGVLRAVDRAGGREALLPLVPLAALAALAATLVVGIIAASGSSGLRSFVGLRRKKPAATTR
jgi:hypothetical protein